MSDAPDTPEAGKTADEAARRRPVAPGAAAASRARRIGGGRVTPRPTPRPTAAGSEPDAAPGEAGVDLAKRSAPATDPAIEPAPGAAVQPAAEPAVQAETTETAEETPAPAAGKPLPIGDGAPPAVPAWLNWAPAGVLAAGCIVMAVLITVFSHGVWWGPDRAAPPSASSVAAKREQVLAAAKSCVVAANDYDYRSLPAYEKKALACTTGGLTSQLKQTIETLIMKNAPTLKAKQATQITRGGIETVTPDGKQWTLLLFGQLSVVNSQEPSGRVDPFAAQVRMEKAGGRWVMAKLSVVSLPASGG